MKAWDNVLTDAKVDLVLSGHFHTYTRCARAMLSGHRVVCAFIGVGRQWCEVRVQPNLTPTPPLPHLQCMQPPLPQHECQGRLLQRTGVHCHGLGRTHRQRQ